MTYGLGALLSLGLLFSTSSFAQSNDALGEQSLAIASTQSEAVLDKTLANLKAVFDNYDFVADSSVTIIQPLQVSGTDAEPTFTVTVKKCVAFICQEVAIDGAISVQSVSGPCDQNYALAINLAGSSSTLTDLYSAIDVAMCYKRTAGGDGTLDLTAVATRAPQFQAGTIQSKILQVLQSQLDPITQAFNKTLINNSN